MISPDQVDGFNIVLGPAGQKYMRQTGPMIPAAWYLTAEDERRIAMTGGTPPQPVNGYMLLDTGAAHLSIDDEVARELKLNVLGRQSEIHGIKGKDLVDQYSARLILPVIPMKDGRALGPQVQIGIPTEAWVSEGIQVNHREGGHVTPQGGTLKVIGVIGRIFLQFTKLTYNGLTGGVEIFIDKSAMFH